MLRNDRNVNFHPMIHHYFEQHLKPLASFWNNNGDSKLCELVPSLARLANELHVVEDQNEEISPYVYVMF